MGKCHCGSVFELVTQEVHHIAPDLLASIVWRLNLMQGNRFSGVLMSVFRHTREFPVAPDAVFSAIQDPKRLARWWGPNGFTNTFQEFQFHVGGSWLFTMHGPDGAAYPNQSEFIEIVPHSLVRIRHVNLPCFELTISLEPSANGTLVSWVGVFENEQFAEKMRQFLESANEQNLDRLAVELGTSAP